MTSQDKRVRWDYAQVSSLDGETLQYYALTERTVSMALTALAVSNWVTRWINRDTGGDWYQIAVEAQNQLMTPASCEAIIACIQANAAQINNILGAGGGSIPGAGGGPNWVVGLGNYPANLLADVSCNPDVLYAVAVQLVDMSVQTVIDAYELFETATNLLELTAALLDNVPSLEPISAGTAAAVGSALEFAQWVQDTAAEAVLAYDTPTHRQEIACAIFCLMRDDCALSFDDLLSFFASRSAVAVIGKTLDQLAGDLVFTSGADVIFNASLALMYAVLSANAKFGGAYGVATVQQWIQAASNDENPDWMIYCDDCPACPTDGAADFSIDAQCYYQDPADAWGVYVPGLYWQSQWSGYGQGNKIVIRNDNLFGGTSQTVTAASVTITGDAIGGGVDGYLDMVAILADGSTVRLQPVQTIHAVGTYTWAGAVANVRGFLVSCNGGNDPAKSFQFTAISLT